MEVYKTAVTCEIAYSVQTPSGDWTKSRVAITSEVGPGYPQKEFLAWVIKSQIADATQACDEQIETIANKIVEQLQPGGDGHVGT